MSNKTLYKINLYYINSIYINSLNSKLYRIDMKTSFVEKEIKMVAIDEFLEKTENYSPLIGFLISFALSFIFSFTPFWYLSLVSAIIGGFFCTFMKWGTLSGFVGVALSWLLYTIIQGASQLVDQVTEIIIGESGLGIIIYILVVLIGGLIGALGGAIGSGIRILVKPSKKSYK
jgi:hypothetical protein